MSPVILKKTIEARKKQRAGQKPLAQKAEQEVFFSADRGAVENLEAEQVAASAYRIRSEVERIRKRVSGQREHKSRRRELRLTPSADDLITCAMEVTGLTAGDLAYEGARNVLEQHHQLQRMQRNRSKASRRRR